MIKYLFQNVPETSVNHTHIGKKLEDYKIRERLGKASCNSAVYAAEVNDSQVTVIVNNVM